uniref:Uncharacterized protein n=1 Tax=Tanacetum cinerariifolium TaxID=118510 RepID=A0A699HB32_TANCI|nr:hypothetical protein [Tanacetum cinerariifolium]
MAVHKISSVVFLVFLGLGISEATRALLTYEESIPYVHVGIEVGGGGGGGGGGSGGGGGGGGGADGGYGSGSGEGAGAGHEKATFIYFLFVPRGNVTLMPTFVLQIIHWDMISCRHAHAVLICKWRDTYDVDECWVRIDVTYNG